MRSNKMAMHTDASPRRADDQIDTSREELHNSLRKNLDRNYNKENKHPYASS